MLRGLFAAISQANFTENYTVFRSMGSPTFQSKYSAEQLKTNFSGVRKLKVDFCNASAPYGLNGLIS